MTELSGDARKLLRAGQRVLAPTPRELETTRVALFAKLAMAVPAARGESALNATPSGVKSTAAVLQHGAIKLTLVSMASIGLVVGLVAVQRGPTDPPSQPAATVADVRPDLSRAANTQLPTKQEISAIPTVPLERRVSPAKPRLRSGETRGRARRRAEPNRADAGLVETRQTAPEPTLAPPPPAQPLAASARATSDNLAREVELIRRARALLQQDRAGPALRQLDIYVAQFPAGILREEQLALRALTLCQLGDVAAARVIIRRMQAVSPGSPHLRRLEQACRVEP